MGFPALGRVARTALAAFVAAFGLASASPAYDSLLMGAFPYEARVLGPWLLPAENGELMLDFVDSLPVSEPALPAEQSVTIISNANEEISVWPIVAINSRGVADGFVIVQRTPLDHSGSTVSRIRVKGRYRSVTNIQLRHSDLKDYLLRQDGASVDYTTQIRATWNIRFALQGRGGPDKETIPEIYSEAEEILAPSYGTISSISPAGRESRVRINLRSSNRTEYTLLNGSTLVGPEAPLRAGNRNFQPTGPIDLWLGDLVVRGVETGLDTRRAVRDEATMHYSSLDWIVTRSPVTSNGRLNARAGLRVRSRVMNTANPWTENNDGRGTLAVTPLTERNGIVRPGRYTYKGTNKHHRGASIRLQRRGFILDDQLAIVEAFQSTGGGKPSGFLSLVPLHQIDLLTSVSIPQTRHVRDARFLGPQTIEP